MKDRFFLREYDLKNGMTSVYLCITGGKDKKRIDIDVKVNRREWDIKKERLVPLSRENQDINLILDNIKAKLTAIKTSYRLAERVISPEQLKKEFLNGMPRIRFTSFFEMALEEEKVLITKGSYNRYRSVLKKIKAYDDDVTFMDIDEEWFDKFKKHLKGIGNQSTTVAGNMAAVKKFLAIALKSGIKLKVNLDEIKVGSTKGNRTSLSAFELKRCAGYYFSDYINPPHRLILGYFLFSCMTGLRISDVQKLTRNNFVDDYITFVSEKTNKDSSIAMNMNARKIVNHEPLLFEKKFADQHINDELRKIMLLLKINKSVSFHVARHTFATSFLRAGGQVEKLQRLLGHSDISQTMIYVHIVQSDANAEIFLLDSLF
jgi:site-specific recombinase XerD